MRLATPKNRPIRIPGSSSKKTDQYYSLLDKFSLIPKYVRDRTVFEITGYPHYENVYSNLLAFYFDPEGEHDLGDILLRSLLKCSATEVGDEQLNVLKVQREAQANGRTRLDILLETDSLIIGIENKVLHHLNNPLGAYEKLLTDSFPGKTPVPIVLSLHPVPETSLTHGFKNITYGQWFKELESAFGPSLLNASPKFQQYLFDFIKTMRRLSGENKMNEHIKSFIIQNHQLVGDLVKDYNSVVADLNSAVPALRQLISVEQYGEKKVSQWEYASFCLVHDFFSEEGTVSIDTNRRFTGWELQLFKRQQKAGALLEKVRMALVEKFGEAIEMPSGGSRYLLRTFPLDADLEEIAEYLRARIEVIDRVISSDPSLAIRE